MLMKCLLPSGDVGYDKMLAQVRNKLWFASLIFAGEKQHFSHLCSGSKKGREKCCTGIAAFILRGISPPLLFSKGRIR